MSNRGFPVVITENATPFTSVSSGAPAAVVTSNKLGKPITLVAEGGTPIVLFAEPQPIIPGPLDVVVMEQGGFNNFSRPFGMASSSAVVLLTCTFEGDPQVNISHGGEPFTILNEVRNSNLISIVAGANNLTLEVANLSVTATGGNLNQGALRINEVMGARIVFDGWTDKNVGIAAPIPPLIMEGTEGGIVKGIFVNKGVDRGLSDRVIGGETTFEGSFMTGEPVLQDFSVNGPWELGTGWSIVGDRFVHTGNVRSAISINHPPATGVAGGRAYVDVHSGSVTMTTGASSAGAGVGEGQIISTALSSSSGGFTRTTISADRQAEVYDVSVVKDGNNISWVFYKTIAEDGKELQPTMTYRPAWAAVAVEVTSENEWSPSDLYTNGEVGAWYDPSDLSTIFQDNAGSTNAVPGTLVALMMDKSGRNNHARQTVLANRPMLQRMPKTGRRNLFEFTEDFSNAYWTKSQVTISGKKIIPSVANTGQYVRRIRSFDAGSKYSYTANSNSAEYEIITIAFPSAAFGVFSWVAFNVRTGLKLSHGGNITWSVTPREDGTFDCSATAIATSSATAGLDLYFGGPNWSGSPVNPNTAGDGVSGIFVNHVQFELGDPTPYQKVVGPFDVTEAGVPDVYSLVFDGVGTFMSVANFDMSSTREVFISCGINSISTSSNILAELSTSASTNVGSFALFPTTGIAGQIGFRSYGTSAAIPVGDGNPPPYKAVISATSNMATPLATLRKDGSVIGTSAASQGAGSYGNYPLFIGRRAGTTSPFSGALYGLIIVGKVPNASDLSNTEKWLADKAGVTL